MALHYRWYGLGPVAKHGIFPRGEGLTVGHLVTTTGQKLALAALLLLAVALWVIVILLLMETTRQLLDTLRFIVDLAHMG